MDTTVQCLPERILVHYQLQMQNFRRLNRKRIVVNCKSGNKEGMVPFEWKEANIMPLFKKGSRKLIKDHIVDFLVRHNLLNPSQHGFLKAWSCLTNMLCFILKKSRS